MNDRIVALPSIDEILGGQSQAGILRPAGLDLPTDDDGTVERVGVAATLTPAAPSAKQAAAAVVAARAELAAAKAASDVARKRHGAAQDALDAAQTEFYRAVDKEFFE